MKKVLFTLVSLFILFSAVFPFSVIAQEMGAIKQYSEMNFPEKIKGPLGDPLPTGTYTIGAGGYFATIQAAFDKLSADGVSGAVVFELIDDLYAAPTGQFGFLLNGPIPGAGVNNTITIKPAANKNVIIGGNSMAVLTLVNISYVNFDGVSLTGATTLTIRALSNTLYGSNDAISFSDNSDYNVIQYITLLCEDYTRFSRAIAFQSYGSSITPDGNLIQNNFIKKAGVAINIATSPSAGRSMNNIIKGNIIGSESDSLLSWGIQLQFTQNTIVENNIVQNIKNALTVGENASLGINSYWGNGDIIRNNIVHNIKNSTGFSSIGIVLSGGSTNVGMNNSVYNNMIYDIQSTSSASNSRVAGIQMWSQNSPKIYYNSVNLSGTGANVLGSAALYLYFLGVPNQNVDVKNNIFVNTRNESPYCASSIYLQGTLASLNSDYNDLYYNNTNPNNCLVRAGGVDYLTLQDWQTMNKDLHSVTEMPHFIIPYLHIDETMGTLLEGGATPIAGINTDFDGETRHATLPDIGADEFSGFVPVELTSFTATSNGKEVILNWITATEINNSGFSIERKSVNSEYLEIGFVPGFGTTAEPKSYSYIDPEVSAGKYKYRLKQIDFDGSFEYSQEIEVEVTALFEFALEQNYPNPFNPSTMIRYQLPVSSDVTLKVFDVLGNEISTLVDEFKQEGKYNIEFNASKLPSGVYFYHLRAGKYVETKRMLLLK